VASAFEIFPLGDSAVAIDLGNRIDLGLNLKAIAIRDWLFSHPFSGMRDLVVAYSSLTVLFDPLLVRKTNPQASTAFEFVRGMLEKAFAASGEKASQPGNQIRIPVCYDEDFGFDQEFICEKKGISREDLIALHHSGVYRVFMIGFLPGFPYLGELDHRISVPRKTRPVALPAGSVGIAGCQTGIYPFNSPGGWQIIGRTPIKLFKAFSEQPASLRIGDHVQFYPVHREQYEGEDWEKMESERLSTDSLMNGNR